MVQESILRYKQGNEDITAYWEGKEPNQLLDTQYSRCAKNDLSIHGFTKRPSIENPRIYGPNPCTDKLWNLCKKVDDLYMYSSRIFGSDKRGRFHTNAYIKPDTLQRNRPVEYPRPNNYLSNEVKKLGQVVYDLEATLMNPNTTKLPPPRKPEPMNYQTQPKGLANNKQQVECYNCHKFGHYAKNCQSKKQVKKERQGNEV